ncbi:MAG: divalent-cation tolerance protein CutA [Proteobacteria bacterium]|jgi:periplasmic divalent cation tolerance protein|nr:divalent-cation tolerance protein CutA [Alphaproteobacteria bacterium]NCC03805.1 divalent-cation tolerance protein CutA [Pseudomonadota bacterium]
MTTDILSVTTTTPDRESAELIAKMVVNENLAACASIDGPVTSVYRWHGQMQETQEYRVVFKTTEGRYQDLENRILSLHPYECPCVVAHPVPEAYWPYVNWVCESVSSR